MKLIVSILCLTAVLSILTGCADKTENKPSLTTKVDSLAIKVNNAYVPGIGELMNGIIQPHHEKLWLAGSHRNWELAAYENHLLTSGFTRIQKYHKSDKVSGLVPMIYPELDAIKKAIADKDARKFNQHFVTLTKTCNTCHQASGYGFNVIQVPAGQAFSNQKF